MSTDKKKLSYLNATIPAQEKETKERNSLKRDERMQKIEDTLAALTDMIIKSNRDDLDAMYNIDMDNLATPLKDMLQSFDDGITQAQADIRTWANAQESGFEAIATWQGNAGTAISELQSTASSQGASIILLNQWKDDTDTVITSLQSTVGDDHASTVILSELISEDESINYAKISQEIGEDFATVDMVASVVDEDGNVNAAGIVAAVNSSSSTLKFNADNVYFTDGNEENIIVSGNKIGINLARGEDESNAYVSFTYDGLYSSNELGYMKATHDSTGEATDNIMGLDIGTRKITRGYTEIRPDVNIESAGYTNMWAHYAVTVQATYDFSTLLFEEYSSVISAMPEDTYFFCTDGIFYHSSGDDLRQIDWS